METTWELDPSHTAAHFSVRHMMISTVRGHFSKVSGTVVTDERDLTRSRVVANIDAASIDTREPKRDAHLKSADFLDVEHFPTLTYKSKRFERIDSTHLKMVGDLTVRDQTREVTVDVELSGAPMKDPFGLIRQGATGTTRLNRKDWGLKWNMALETGGVLVGDEVQVTLDVELTKKQ